jgi:SAM-dependent methyltransferase
MSTTTSRLDATLTRICQGCCVETKAATSWGRGDYAQMATRLAPVAEGAVARLAVGARDSVLDLACGDGNAALAAARSGASRVVGIDFEPALLDRARQRDTGRQVQWHLGDIQTLELRGETYDVILSIFGVMYAADQDRVAAQIARACAPGTRVALSAWTPGSFMPEMGRVLAPYLPSPPSNSAPPSRWGDASAVEALLRPHGLSITDAAQDLVELVFDDRDDAVEFLIQTAGHVVQERARLVREERWDALRRDLGDLVAKRDQPGDGEVRLPLEYLLAIGEAAAR